MSLKYKLHHHANLYKLVSFNPKTKTFHSNKSLNRQTNLLRTISFDHCKLKLSEILISKALNKNFSRSGKTTNYNKRMKTSCGNNKTTATARNFSTNKPRKSVKFFLNPITAFFIPEFISFTLTKLTAICKI